MERDWGGVFKRQQPTSNMGVFIAEMSSDYFFSFWGMAEARNASSALVLLSLAEMSSDYFFICFVMHPCLKP